MVKFREVSGTVWVSFEAMVIEKTTQENERIKISFTIILQLLYYYSA